MKLKIYGSRGSVAFFGRKNIEYGGNTVCTVIEVNGHTVVLDCGTALMQYYYDKKAEYGDSFKFDILLSHLHLDHIIGLSTFSPLMSDNSDIRIFTKSRSDLPLSEQVFGIYKPPYWPIDMAEYSKAAMVEIKEEKTFTLHDGIKVTPFWSMHHDDTVAFRIDATENGSEKSSKKSIVYLLDYEIRNASGRYDALLDFCRNADIVILDATYLPEDYPSRQGWGHSTYEHGVTLARDCQCKKMVLSHICQDYTDDVLNSVKSRLDGSRFCLAYDGLELNI